MDPLEKIYLKQKNTHFTSDSMSLSIVIRILFDSILFLILFFYYKLFFILLQDKSVLEYQNKIPIHQLRLFYNGSFNKNINTDFWNYIFNKFNGVLLKKTIHLTVYFNFQSRILEPKVLLGKAGFFYYFFKRDGNNLGDFFKQNLAGQPQIDTATAKVKDFMNLCSSLNIPFLLIIGPNKHSIYPEYVPLQRPEGITRADQLIQVFESVNASYIFPRDYLIELKSKSKFPLYFETDTHWNSLGAFYTFQLIKEKIKGFFPNLTFPEINYNISAKLVNGSGDIISMSPKINRAEKWSTQVTIVPENGLNSSYIVTDKIKLNFRTIGKNQSLPRALIYRDSFFSYLVPFVSPMFSNVEYIWGKMDKKHIMKAKPDILIYEVVERHCLYFFT